MIKKGRLSNVWKELVTIKDHLRSVKRWTISQYFEVNVSETLTGVPYSTEVTTEIRDLRSRTTNKPKSNNEEKGKFSE